MKNALQTIALFLLVCSGCNEQNSKTTSQSDKLQRTQNLLSPNDDDYSKEINIDTANRMISSYLTGINYEVNTEEIKSLFVDANVLKNYMDQADTAHPIKKFKLVFAHSLDYIHHGQEGLRPDSNSHALTLVVVGVDGDGNYVYTNNHTAIDYVQPCPNSCPSEGTSADNLLTQ